MEDREPEEEDQERPRPRVVDRRISAGGHSGPAKSPRPEPQAPPEPQQPDQPAPAGAPESGQVWTPEKEAEARAMAQQIAEVPSVEWVVNTALTLANVAAAKLELGEPADAQLAIDALAGLINSVGSQLTGAEGPLRNTLSQLQMAYAERVSPPPDRPE